MFLRLFVTVQAIILCSLCLSLDVLPQQKTPEWLSAGEAVTSVEVENNIPQDLEVLISQELMSEKCPIDDPCRALVRLFTVSSTALDPEGDNIQFQYNVSGGKIVGHGSEVVWDLSEVRPGTYTLELCASDNNGCFASNSAGAAIEILAETEDQELERLNSALASGVEFLKDDDPDPWSEHNKPVITYFVADRVEVPACQVECRSAATHVNLFVGAVAEDENDFAFEYLVKEGMIVGKGSEVYWNLANVPPGVYEVTVRAKNQKDRESEPMTLTVTVT